MSETAMDQGESRRGFITKLTGWVIGLGALAGSWPLVRALIPNVLYEPPKRFKIGRPENFTAGVHFLEQYRLFVFRQDNAFHVVSGSCTHLGCMLKFSPFKTGRELTVRNLTYESQGEFHCACHGSKFHDDGTNFSGPAPRPLAWYQVDLSPENGELVVDVSEEVDRDFRLVV